MWCVIYWQKPRSRVVQSQSFCTRGLGMQNLGVRTTAIACDSALEMGICDCADFRCRHSVCSVYDRTLIALDAPPRSTPSTVSWWLRTGLGGAVLCLGLSTRHL